MLRNKVFQRIKEIGMTRKEFVARCMLAGLGNDTAYRLLRPHETKFETGTLAVAAQVLGVSSIADLIDLEDTPNQPILS